MKVNIDGIDYVPSHKANIKTGAELCDTLALLRKTSGESLQQVASSIGTSKAHVWELEKGMSKNPTLKILKGITAHYGISPEELW